MEQVDTKKAGLFHRSLFLGYFPFTFRPELKTAAARIDTSPRLLNILLLFLLSHSSCECLARLAFFDQMSILADYFSSSPPLVKKRRRRNGTLVVAGLREEGSTAKMDLNSGGCPAVYSPRVSALSVLLDRALGRR